MVVRIARRGLGHFVWPSASKSCFRQTLHVQASSSSDQDQGCRDTKANVTDALGRPIGPCPGDEAILTLSGGVDSSVAAYLAIVKGGLRPRRTIFMRNWNALEEGESFEPGAGGAQGCQWMRDWERVQRMARWLNVEPELIDLSTEYWNNVFAPSLDQWQRGRTPNPDILCNSEIKFGELLRRLDQEERIHRQQEPAAGEPAKRRWLITGHYAHVEYFYPFDDSRSPLLHGRLHRASDVDKDQSYFLSGVDAVHLGRSHFPLAKMHKTDVRRLARSLGMPTAESEESMGICFVGKRKRQAKGNGEMQRGRGSQAVQLGFAGFLDEYIDAKPGKIVTLDGRELGMHSGLHTLTVGQGAKIGGARHRYFVAAKNIKNNEIIVVPGSDHPMLQCHSLLIDDFHLILPQEGDVSMERFDGKTPLQAQIRHRQEPVPCHAKVVKNEKASKRQWQIVFDEPVSSVAAGQVCALYDRSECVGSGVVCEIETMAARKHVERSLHSCQTFV